MSIPNNRTQSKRKTNLALAPRLVRSNNIIKEYKTMKNYTWDVSGIDKNGETTRANVTDRARGYRRGWYKTEESARKAMIAHVKLLTVWGCTEIKWVLYYRHNGITSAIDFGE